MNPFFLLLIGSLAEAAADVLFKFWTIDNKILWLAIGIILYGIGTAVWAYSLKFEPLSKGIDIFTILNLIFVILAGLILFGEKLSLYSKVGIVLGVVSVSLMLK